MKFTLSWLKEFLETNASITEISSTLTTIGLEVEQIIDHSKILEPFIVAYIKEVSPHPEADRLKICQIDTGKEILQIVCGGVNARTGIKVVLAPIDSIIPTNQIKIRASTIRNVSSNGMLCSAEELGIGDSNGGIIELPDEAVIGESCVKYLGADDAVIEISVTPNRGDCLGIYGIARDLAASGIGKLIKPNIPTLNGTFTSPYKVKVEDNLNCPKFLGRYIKNVKNGESPGWLQNRLKAIGVNPISILVDITNYITFTYGRPLHVYDADKLNGDIIVKTANKGQEFIALNDKTYKTHGGEVVVTNNERIIGFGGIIGEKTTSVDVSTTNIFLEAALFNPTQIAKTGRLHQIDTDARYRFERNVDPLFVEDGITIATQMITDICGGEVSIVENTGTFNFQPVTIKFPIAFVKQRGGIELSKERIITILNALNFNITDQGEEIELIVPSWRSDITIKEGIVEEVLRINGYDNIPATPIPVNDHIPPKVLSEKQLYKSRIKRILANDGYFEVVTWSFMNKNKAKHFTTTIKPELILVNPISTDLDYMRPSIIPNLLLAINKNKARGFHNLALFEVGPTFDSVEPQGHKLTVSGIRTGKDSDKNIYTKPREIDVFDIKADVFDFIEECGFNPHNFQLNSNNLPNWLHPSKSIMLSIGKSTIGYIGEIHPLILRDFDIKDRVCGFELFIGNLPIARNKKGRKSAPDYSDYQMVERDFAFLVDINTPIANIVKSVINIDKQLIKDVFIFDIYAGNNIDSTKKSVALTVKMQANDRTLTDQEIENISSKIIANITTSIGGVLRN